ncbi:DedA family protein [Marinomonas piezotolerans]|uniref:DedA family protein n=1 Tax=Marinomonas piezotolerans TaxID=2213058 RepID=A0A370UCW5_9GAMM|nr:VTT domain-containing protein [Marinomonas piezotolerans]RDL45632.1 DedA family protein [Marinomonas piezotolerans]
MIDHFLQELSSGHHTIWFFIVGIILLSYLLEDLAIVTAASLAAQDKLPISLAMIAIAFGIITGDAGLYYLGLIARKVRYLRYKALKNPYFKWLRNRLNNNAFLNIFVIRFIPGLRTVGFTMSGFFLIPLPVFLSAVIFATTLWTGVVFSVVYYFGTRAWVQTAQYQWLLIPIAAGVLLIMNRIVRRSISRELL